MVKLNKENKQQQNKKVGVRFIGINEKCFDAAFMQILSGTFEIYF